MDHAALKALLEAIIYVSEEPVALEQLAAALEGVTREELQAALAELVADSRASARGVEIRQVAGGYKMYTKTEHHEAVRQFVRKQKPPLRLTLPALETLAVVAYKQPVTLPEIQHIRGVHAVSVIKTLLDKGLIVTAGRKQCIGRPILYRTSKEFLLRFGLKDLGELPTLEEFEALARASMAEVAEAPVEAALPNSDAANASNG
ncbi:MAG: SMC-Scp complex subunit ScpB [Acidobacteria bacterium]|nr:SMC-Scp complex subunit ScpB [Acidobacteriota bacterium]